MIKKYEVRVSVEEGGFGYYTNSLLKALYAMHYYYKQNCKDNNFRFVEIIRR